VLLCIADINFYATSRLRNRFYRQLKLFVYSRLARKCLGNINVAYVLLWKWVYIQYCRRSDVDGHDPAEFPIKSILGLKYFSPYR
jgi:hypothetical protein